MLRQRIYAMCLGYEDLNDHGTLRTDVALQSAVGVDEPLASAPTLCRLENRANRAAAWAMHAVLLEQFVASFKAPPEELVLDFDATDVPLHGLQQQRFFHGYYDAYCYLPLYVFCGQQMLAAYLRPSRIDAAKHAGAVLKLLVGRLRQAWPGVRIVLRADSGFCRQRILAWCERHDVGYVVGLAKNRRLIGAVEFYQRRIAALHAAHGTKQRLITEFVYAARTWSRQRRVIARLEHGHQGTNPRFILTNLPGEPGALYERLYCARGEAENRIKEAQLGLFATRASCQRFAANQFRVLLSAMAYTLIERLRALVLAGTELARAQADTIRIRLLKLGAVIVRNTRRIHLWLSDAFPQRALFASVAAQLHGP